MRRWIWYTIVFVVSSVVLFFISLFLYYRFLYEPIWRLESYLLENHGTTVTGRVVHYTKSPNPSDSEYEDYIVSYEYTTGGRQRRGKHEFSLNTAHIGYANAGMMFDLPKLMTTVENIEETFQPGSPVYITLVPRWPMLKKIEYEKHPNELIDEQILEDYRNRKSSQ